MKKNFTPHLKQRLRRSSIALFVAVVSALPAISQAFVQVGRESSLYYEVGGSSATPLPQHFGKSHLIKLSAGARANYSCGNFNILENLEELFDQFKNAGDQAILILQAAAASIIDALPLYILYRADPNLAQMFVNAMARYEELIRIAVRDCEETERAILSGENPFKGWIRISKSKKWGDAVEEGATATAAQEAVNSEPGSIVWVDGEERAGEGQEPIQVIGDVAAVGYRLLTEDADDPNGDEDARIAVIWPSEDDVRLWTTGVLGELEISMVDDPQQTPGVGISRRLSDVREEITEALLEIIFDQTAYSGEALEEKLAEFEAPGIRLTADLINALREMATTTQTIFTGRLTTEIAAARVAEEILLMRRILLTGSREPHVYATPAWAHIRDYAIPELDREYEYLRQDNAFRREFVSKTASDILDNFYIQQSEVPAANAPATGTEHGDVPIRDGAVFLPGTP